MVEWSSTECKIYVVNVLAIKRPFFENTMNWLTMSLSFSDFPFLSLVILSEWCILNVQELSLSNSTHHYTWTLLVRRQGSVSTVPLCCELGFTHFSLTHCS
jgi:hypothetical protein